jgi:uncharacterized membrane protein YeaQ/YmgE (transglycosylase-associated protein family)
MDQGALIVTLIVGAIVGYLAAKVLSRTGFGVIGDLVVSMVGSLIGSWVWNFLHPVEDHDFEFFLHTAAAAAVGGLVLLILWRIARR